MNIHRKSIWDILAVALALSATLLTHRLAGEIFDFLPHLEDEIAYTWQARVYAAGQLSVPSPVEEKSFMVPFVVDYNGRRFAKYPPGWSMVLAFGERLGARAWVNPLLAGLGLWLIYRLGQRWSAAIGLLAAGLTLTSPFFLLNSASLLSHPWSLVLTLAFTLAWLDLFVEEGRSFVLARAEFWLRSAVAGLSLGALGITRPLTAGAVALPFLIHGLWLLCRGRRAEKVSVLLIGLLALSVLALLPHWQYAVTGDPWLNPYTLWWPYDKVGFGEGYGRQEGGHSLYWAWVNLQVSLKAGWKDLFGWAGLSWLFLPFGVTAFFVRPGRERLRRRAGLLVAAIPLSLVLFYMAYWIGSALFGPRYYYEGLGAVSLLTALGIFWIGEIPLPALLRKGVRGALLLLLALLIGYNLTVYLPQRLEEMRGLYGIRRAHLEPFFTPQAQALTPALVFIRIQKQWTEYGTFLDLEDPWLRSPFIFALSRGAAADERVMAAFPNRRVFYYSPLEPGIFKERRH